MSLNNLNISENKENVDSQGKNDIEKQEEISQLRKLLEIKEKELKTSKEILDMREKIKTRDFEYRTKNDKEYKETKIETIKESKKEVPEQHFEDLTMSRKAVPTKAQIKKITHQMKDADIAHQLIVLVDLARFRGVYHAINIAKKLGNVYLLDRLHDAIVNDLYEGLIKTKKLRS